MTENKRQDNILVDVVGDDSPKYVIYTLIQSRYKKSLTLSLPQLIAYIKQHRVGYELIRDVCIPYYDFEKYYDSRDEQVNAWKTDFEMCLTAVTGMHHKKADVMAFDASGHDPCKNSWKNSFHFRVRKAGYFASAEQIKKQPGFDELVKKGFDPNVYRPFEQLFRLPFCCKEIYRDTGKKSKKGMPIMEPTGEKQDRPLLRLYGNDKVTLEMFEEGALVETLEDWLVQNVKGEKLIELSGVSERKMPPATSKEPVKAVDSMDDYDAFEEQMKPGVQEKTVVPAEMLRKLLLEVLHVKRATEFKDWQVALWTLKNIADDQEMDFLELAHDFSKRCMDKYTNKGGRERTDVEYKFPNPDRARRSTLGKFIEWAKVDNPEALKKWYEELHQKTEAKETKKFEYEQFDDHKQMFGETVELEEVERWMKSTVVYIANGGQPNILTREVSTDFRNNVKQDHWMMVSQEGLLKTLDATVYVKNPLFNPSDKKSKQPEYWSSLKTACSYLIKNRRVPYFRKIDFYPLNKTEPSEEIKKEMAKDFNLFTGFALKDYMPTKKYDFEQSAFYKFFMEEYLNKDAALQYFVPRWIADLIQYPEVVPQTCLIMIGEEGTGKDLIVEFLRGLIGVNYYHQYLNLDLFFNHFNKQQEGKLLISLNELSDQGNSEQKFRFEEFKGRITSADIDITSKGVNSYRMRHMTRYIGQSNNDGCMKTRKGDRRTVYIYTSNRYAKNREYFGPIFKEIRDRDFLKAAFDYFNAMDIKKFHDSEVMNAPMTEFKSQRTLADMSSSLKFLKEFCENHDEKAHFEGSDYFYWDGEELRASHADFYKSYFEWCKQEAGCMPLKKDNFVSELQKFGMVSTRPRIKGTEAKEFRIVGWKYNIKEIEKMFEKYSGAKDFKFERLDKD